MSKNSPCTSHFPRFGKKCRKEEKNVSHFISSPVTPVLCSRYVHGPFPVQSAAAPLVYFQSNMKKGKFRRFWESSTKQHESNGPWSFREPLRARQPISSSANLESSFLSFLPFRTVRNSSWRPRVWTERWDRRRRSFWSWLPSEKERRGQKTSKETRPTPTVIIYHYVEWSLLQCIRVPLTKL